MMVEYSPKRRIMMEWGKQEQQHHEELPLNSNNNNNNGMFVKVIMTDEQIEVLRKQIAVYATICEQLVQMYESLTSHHDLTGARLGNLFCDPLMTFSSHKITGRQRWTPSKDQLEKLERYFSQGIGTPNKQKIREITSELSQDAPISEANVYNWFQNRRARSKRKQQVAKTIKAESEVDIGFEPPEEKFTLPTSHK